MSAGFITDAITVARALATHIPSMSQALFSKLEDHDWTDIFGWDELPEELVLSLSDR
jgi:hypothetical protein